jgi:hypothetical protein
MVSSRYWKLTVSPLCTDYETRVILVLLGHSKWETTSHYTQVATNLLRTVTSPIDNLTLTKEEPPA